MKHLGMYFRQRRKSLSLSLQHVVGQEFSKQALSKFEKGETQINSSYLMYMIDRLQIEPFELWHACELSDSNEMTTVQLNSLREAFYTKSVENLRVQVTQNNRKVESYKISDHHINLMIELLIEFIDTEHIDDTLVHEIQSFLFESANWGAYECHLFSHSIYCLDSHFVRRMMPEYLSVIRKYADEKMNISYFSDELLHLSYQLLMWHSELFDPTYRQIVNWIKEHQLWRHQIFLDFLEGLSGIVLREQEGQGKKQCEQAIAVTDQFGDTHSRDRMRQILLASLSS